MENRITKAGLMLVLAVTGTQIMQAGDMLDDMATYYAREYKPRMQKYDERVRLMRSFNRNPEQFGRLQGFLNEARQTRRTPEADDALVKKYLLNSALRFRPLQLDYRLGRLDPILDYWEQSGDLVVPQDVINRLRSNVYVSPEEVDIRKYVSGKIERDRPTWAKFTAPIYNWYYRK